MMNDWWVFAWILVVASASAGYAAFDRSRFGPCLALVILACGMFSYSIVFFNAASPVHWFYTAPPWFISRMVLAAAAVIAFAALWRVDLRTLASAPSIVVLGLVAIIIVPVSLLNLAFGNIDNLIVPKQVVLIFSCLLSLMLCLPFALTLAIEQRSANVASANLAVMVSVLLCAAIAILGYLEVVLDVGAVRNMFIPGVVETRGSSSFLNPNWFAIGLAFFVFLALLLALKGRRWSALTISTFSAIGLVAASSRSVFSIQIASMMIFVLCGLFSGQHTRREVLRAMGITFSGWMLGVAAGLLVALALGETAWARFLTVLVRLLLWPLLVLSQSAAFQSIFGRIDVSSLFRATGDATVLRDGIPDFAVGSGLVDSAYLFLAVVNPPALLLLVTFLVLLLYLVLRTWRQQRTASSTLNIAIVTFIILVGFVAQAYWAFPVWLILAVMLTWVLSQIRADTVATTGRPV